MLRESGARRQGLWFFRRYDVGRRMIGARWWRRTCRPFIDGRHHIAAGRRRGGIDDVRTAALPPQAEPEQQRTDGDDQEADGPAAAPATE
jgi:hypothetical protein